MKQWASKNRGKPLYKMFSGNEYAFSVFVLMNFKDVWKRSWDYNVLNQACSTQDNILFKKYSAMSLSEAEEGGDSEVANWNKYRPLKAKFTNAPKRRCQESVTNQGMAFYYRHYKLWREFFALDEQDQRRVKFDVVWDQVEGELNLTERVMSRKRKRADVVVETGDTDEVPPLPSPVTVVMPNEEGFDDYLKQMEDRYALDEDEWKDDGADRGENGPMLEVGVGV